MRKLRLRGVGLQDQTTTLSALEPLTSGGCWALRPLQVTQQCPLTPALGLTWKEGEEEALLLQLLTRRVPQAHPAA